MAQGEAGHIGPAEGVTSSAGDERGKEEEEAEAEQGNESSEAPFAHDTSQDGAGGVATQGEGGGGDDSEAGGAGGAGEAAGDAHANGTDESPTAPDTSTSEAKPPVSGLRTQQSSVTISEVEEEGSTDEEEKEEEETLSPLHLNRLASFSRDPMSSPKGGRTPKTPLRVERRRSVTMLSARRVRRCVYPQLAFTGPPRSHALTRSPPPSAIAFPPHSSRRCEEWAPAFWQLSNLTSGRTTFAFRCGRRRPPAVRPAPALDAAHRARMHRWSSFMNLSWRCGSMPTTKAIRSTFVRRHRHAVCARVLADIMWRAAHLRRNGHGGGGLQRVVRHQGRSCDQV